MAAPVCRIAPASTPISSQPPPVTVPSIPPIDGSMGSIIAALNAMKIAIEGLYGLQGIVRAPAANKSPSPSKPSPKKTGRFNETKRTSAKVKVTNPDDDSQYVMVDQINSLTFTDSVTGETWQWNR